MGFFSDAGTLISMAWQHLPPEATTHHVGEWAKIGVLCEFEQRSFLGFPWRYARGSFSFGFENRGFGLGHLRRARRPPVALEACESQATGGSWSKRAAPEKSMVDAKKSLVQQGCWKKWLFHVTDPSRVPRGSKDDKQTLCSCRACAGHIVLNR